MSGDRKCPYCGEPILRGQPTAMPDGERLHLDCAAADLDDAFFDRDRDD